MLNLLLDKPGPGGLRVLCLGAHADDIEIGCAGTLFSLLKERAGLEVHWIVFSARGQREEEARVSAASLLEGVEKAQVEALSFRDGFFPSEIGGIKEYFEGIKARFEPDLILTHWEGDRHQDHRVISELTWNTFRNHLVFEYEVPKYDGDLGHPNLFVPLSEEVRQRKVEHLMDSFASQRPKHWYTPDTFQAIMRIRGLEGASPTGYAEAFHARKVILPVHG